MNYYLLYFEILNLTLEIHMYWGDIIICFLFLSPTSETTR